MLTPASTSADTRVAPRSRAEPLRISRPGNSPIPRISAGAVGAQRCRRCGKATSRPVAQGSSCRCPPRAIGRQHSVPRREQAPSGVWIGCPRWGSELQGPDVRAVFSLAERGCDVPEHEPDLGIGVRPEYLLKRDRDQCLTEVKEFAPGSWPIRRGSNSQQRVLKPIGARSIRRRGSCATPSRSDARSSSSLPIRMKPSGDCCGRASSSLPCTAT
jgi:hypothetical protein